MLKTQPFGSIFLFNDKENTRYFHITHNPLCLGGQERQTSNKYGVCCVLVVVYFVMGKSDFCCAAYCSNRRNKQPELEYYRIPKEEKLRAKWLPLIRRENFTPNDNTRLRSQHFIGGKRSLDKGSTSYLPTIFKRGKETLTQRKTRTSQRTKTVPIQLIKNAARRKAMSKASTLVVVKYIHIVVQSGVQKY